MKRKRNSSALKVTFAAVMMTAALTFGAGSAYAAENTNEPTVTVTPSPEVTPEVPLPTATPTPAPKKGLLKEGKIYRYYVNNKPIRNKWKKVNGKYYWFKSNGVAAHDGLLCI